MSVVELDYADLKNGKDLSGSIALAFGKESTCLGLLTVKNVPGYEAARKRLLKLSHTFGNFDQTVLSKYEHAASNYSFGWSHGKERLEGKLDVSKGSFYANPQFDKPTDDQELIERYAEFVHPNIWPTNELPELETAFKELGQLIVEVGVLVSKQCDIYIQKVCPSYEPKKLERTISSSICTKGRLLHYFPVLANGDKASVSQESGSFSDWCGWHNDHGSLTGLTSAMYMSPSGEEVQNSDPVSGLYICNRMGDICKVSIPVANIAFQIGETAQVHSGGILQATPHAVRGTSQAGVSRETFAVFMEPNFGEPMNIPAGVDVETTQSQSSAKNLPRGVPTLASRWNPSQNFSDFTKATLSAYY